MPKPYTGKKREGFKDREDNTRFQPSANAELEGDVWESAAAGEGV